MRPVPTKRIACQLHLTDGGEPSGGQALCDVPADAARVELARGQALGRAAKQIEQLALAFRALHSGIVAKRGETDPRDGSEGIAAAGERLAHFDEPIAKQTVDGALGLRTVE